MAGLQLDVRLGVARGCFVGEGCVAEVMKGSKRFLDPGSGPIRNVTWRRNPDGASSLLCMTTTVALLGRSPRGGCLHPVLHAGTHGDSAQAA